jgi:hypothetical protein
LVKKLCLKFVTQNVRIKLYSCLNENARPYLDTELNIVLDGTVVFSLVHVQARDCQNLGRNETAVAA